MATTARSLRSRPLPGTPESELVRDYVWELPVRISHWLIFFAVAVLAFTGYYMHRPFLTVSGDETFTMAKMRFYHIIAGFVFSMAFVLRIYWMFGGNRCARWSAFIPLRKRQWSGIGHMVKYYTFLEWSPTHQVGHNALAAATYTLLFGVMFIQIITGFVLLNQVLDSGLLHFLFGWISGLIDIQYLRLIHYCVMWIFFVFVIHHVYSGVLVSTEEKNALMESIFTGYKFVPRWDLTDEESPCPDPRRRHPAPPGPS